MVSCLPRWMNSLFRNRNPGAGGQGGRESHSLEVLKGVLGNKLASFPGLPWLQFLIACSMQKWMGEGLGDLVTCMVSGRQNVDRWGAVPDCCNSQTLR